MTIEMSSELSTEDTPSGSTNFRSLACFYYLLCNHKIYSDEAKVK